MNHITLDLSDALVEQLRQVMDSLPLRTHAVLIVTVLKALPMTDSVAVPTPSPEGVPHAHTGPVSRAGTFSMTALTDKGRARIPEIEALLGSLEKLQ